MEKPVKFGRYELIERLAVGGMAELYQAVLSGPSGFSKTVAIKKILPNLNKHSRFRKMFLHEGRITAAISHRNIVQVFELGEENGELFMCLEFVSGCDLAHVLRHLKKKNTAMNPYLAAWIARELCRGLEYVHSLKDDRNRPLNVVHRDVNPHNILLSTHGDVKLGDFGIAKSLIGSVQTIQGQVRGKLEYLSPEQALGDTVGPASDLYAVGLVLFEMLTLQRYIQGVGQADFLNNAIKPLWRPISKYNKDVPAQLESIVGRTLRAEPEKRFASASAFADMLTQFIESAPHMSYSNKLAGHVITVSDLGKTKLDKHKNGTPEVDTDVPTEPDELARPSAARPAETSSEPHSQTISLAGESRESATSSRSSRLLKLFLPLGLLVAAVAVTIVLIKPNQSSVPDEKPVFADSIKTNQPQEPVDKPVDTEKPDKPQELAPEPVEDDKLATIDLTEVLAPEPLSSISMRILPLSCLAPNLILDGFAESSSIQASTAFSRILINAVRISTGSSSIIPRGCLKSRARSMGRPSVFGVIMAATSVRNATTSIFSHFKDRSLA